MGKSVHRRRIRGPLTQTALLACFIVAFLAQLATWRSTWLIHAFGASSVTVMNWLLVAADGLTMLACAAACVVLGRLVWLMRRQPAFRTAAVGLMLVLALAGAKRLLDLMGYNVGGAGESRTMLGLSSLVLAGGVVLLLPMLYQVKAFGEAAELAHERFVSAAETGRQAFFILESDRSPFNKTGDFRFSFVNANAEKLLMHRRRDLIGMPFSHALPTLPESSLVERLHQVERTGLPYSGEIRYRSDSGDDLWFEIQAVKMQNGVAVTLHDVSAERSGQRQVEEMHRFSQSLIHDAPFAILTTDTSGKITGMNPAAERLTGFDSEAVVGHVSLVDLHDPEELRDRVIGQTGRDTSIAAVSFESLLLLLGDRSSAEADWHYVCPDGARVPVHVSLTALRGDNNEISGYLATAYDISERKKFNRFDYIPGAT